MPKKLVPGEGLEPTHPLGQRILSPPRLPFRHPGFSSWGYTGSNLRAFDYSEVVKIKEAGKGGTNKGLTDPENWQLTPIKSLRLKV